MSAEYFDIEKVTQTFENSLHEEDDVLMAEYLLAYEEINKFFQLLGSVFSFVSSDVRSKIDILLEFQKAVETKEKFSTIKTMIEHEKQADLLRAPKYVSGSRTLLRLHRGLEFVYEFLNRLSELHEYDKIHNSCRDAYNDTLAKHHTFLIRKGALMAMYALPTQGELLKRVCANVPRAKEVLPEMLKRTKSVYERTDKLYTLYELHALP